MNPFLKANTTLKNLAAVLNCAYSGNPETQVKYIGDINYIIRGIRNFKENCIYYAEDQGTYSHCNPKTILLTKAEFARHHIGNCIIIPENRHPKEIFIKLLEWFAGHFKPVNTSDKLIHDKSNIAPSATIFPGAYVGPGAVIEEHCIINPFAVIDSNAVVKKNSIIHSGVHIGANCVIGENNVIYANSVIGSDGFGYIDIEGNRFKIPQIGNVITANYVEIGSCTTIDRSTIESTEIGENTKIDNQVQIAHNCIIGKNVYIAGKASLAGSITVGNEAILAGGCGIRDHVNIGSKSVILAMTGIEADTDPGKVYFGIPARPVKEMHRINSALSQLPEIAKIFKKNNT